MMIRGFVSNKVSKSLNFCRRGNHLSPLVCTCMAIKYGSKLVQLIRMRVPFYVILNTSDYNSYLKNNHEYLKCQREKGFGNQYQLFNWSDLYNEIVCKMHMFIACSIFIINASLWETLQATLLF